MNLYRTTTKTAVVFSYYYKNRTFKVKFKKLQDANPQTDAINYNNDKEYRKQLDVCFKIGNSPYARAVSFKEVLKAVKRVVK